MALILLECLKKNKVNGSAVRLRRRYNRSDLGNQALGGEINVLSPKLRAMCVFLDLSKPYDLVHREASHYYGSMESQNTWPMKLIEYMPLGTGTKEKWKKCLSDE